MIINPNKQHLNYIKISPDKSEELFTGCTIWIGGAEKMVLYAQVKILSLILRWQNSRGYQNNQQKYDLNSKMGGYNKQSSVTDYQSQGLWNQFLEINQIDIYLLLPHSYYRAKSNRVLNPRTRWTNLHTICFYLNMILLTYDCNRHD